MTDTVAVPLHLLKNLQATYQGGAGPYAHAAIADLTALIPAPPKVGDTLAEFAQLADLPYATVLVDSDGDVYVTSEGKATRVTDTVYIGTEVQVRNTLSDYAFEQYGPFTVFYLPESK